MHTHDCVIFPNKILLLPPIIIYEQSRFFRLTCVGAAFSISRYQVSNGTLSVKYYLRICVYYVKHSTRELLRGVFLSLLKCKYSSACQFF